MTMNTEGWQFDFTEPADFSVKIFLDSIIIIIIIIIKLFGRI